MKSMIPASTSSRSLRTCTAARGVSWGRTASSGSSTGPSDGGAATTTAASRTAALANSLLRPRSSARDSRRASAALPTFSDRSLPSSAIGVAAPISVPGAMDSRCAEYPMYMPALAACAPDGPTHTMTGTVLSRMPVTIRSMDSPSPPGVSS